MWRLIAGLAGHATALQQGPASRPFWPLFPKQTPKAFHPALLRNGVSVIRPWHHPYKKRFRLIVNLLTMPYLNMIIFVLLILWKVKRQMSLITIWRMYIFWNYRMLDFRKIAGLYTIEKICCQSFTCFIPYSMNSSEWLWCRFIFATERAW